MTQRYPLAVILITLTFSTGASAQQWTQTTDGRVDISPVAVDKKFRNRDWPTDWERGFWQRANYVIEQTARNGSYGNTFFENEKRAYGWAMLSVLGGFEEQGFKFLQEEDDMGQRWNKHTLGIDYYPCFTLKHQMRKYFFFESLICFWVAAARRVRISIFGLRCPSVASLRSAI